MATTSNQSSGEHQAGHCHCGAIRFMVTGSAENVALCHCSDCRRAAGAPMVAWAGFRDAQLEVTQGTPRVRNSSGTTMRSFCGDCGTGLFYRNEAVLPGKVEVQVAAFDDPAAFAPQVHIQTADRLGWMAGAHTLPAFEAFPEQ